MPAAAVIRLLRSVDARRLSNGIISFQDGLPAILSVAATHVSSSCALDIIFGKINEKLRLIGRYPLMYRTGFSLRIHSSGENNVWKTENYTTQYTLHEHTN